MQTTTSEKTQWHLCKSDGYMDLDMWQQAEAELHAITTSERNHFIYRQLRLRLAMGRENWPVATRVAKNLCEDDPEQPGNWIQLAFATRRFAGLSAARKVLIDAYKRFPTVAVIPFNLACYECQLGREDSALNFLSRAEKLEPTCRKLALENEDLKPLWDTLYQTS